MPSKASTAQATVSTDKNENRWFRVKLPQAELPEIDHFFDAYWGGPERRITGLTLRIISVNAIALLTLVIGILYLGQYQDRIITTKLENFENETLIIAGALNITGTDETRTKTLLNYYATNFNKDITLYDSNAQEHIKQTAPPHTHIRHEYTSIRILKETARFIIDLLPHKKQLPPYPQNTLHPDIKAAANGTLNLSAWQGNDDNIILSAAAPLIRDNTIQGFILIKDTNHNIGESVAAVWIDVLRIFLITLLITIALSIYLSGVIARPLKKLAKTAEAVRTGRAKITNIPDFSHRHDEIGDLSIALKSMITALFERMDSIESFAADVAHELKNPLTSLKSAIETLSKVKKASDRKKLMGIIEHDITRMDRLITDISGASRLDAELSREEFAPLDLKPLLEQIIDTYQNPLKRGKKNEIVTTANNVTITFKSQNTSPATISGTAHRLEQVFKNIIDNALSFSPEGGQITIAITQNKQEITISITDEGRGIPDHKLETIFERFYTERPDQDYGQNSGLGLSICKQIIDAHDGEISAENTKNGAKFTITLKAL
ncbi:MAG: ATP-binding protein [Alphaproteobacteria bacterium]